MTSIDPTTATAAAAAGSEPPASALGQLDSDAFLKLLVAQLRYQDPMAPSDSSAMLEQTAQFTQVETMQQLASIQEQLTSLQQTSMASNLIGREVVATTETGAEVRGIVDGVRFAEGEPLLLVEDTAVPFTRAREIRATTS